jgi:hypothetical protein
MALAQAQLTASAKTVAFVANGENAITCLIFCNTSLTTDDIISCWIVPGAIAAGDANMVINQIPLPAGETFSMDTERFILANGDSIQAQAGQNGLVTVTVSYVQTG